MEFLVAPLCFLLFVGFIVLVVLGILYGKKQEEERLRALAALAAEKGLQFSPADPFGLPARLEHIAPFGSGHDQEATNVLHGDLAGRRVILFDYKYTTTERTTDSKGRSRTREVDHHLSACVHPLEWAFPGLVIRPEGFFDKVAGFFGFDDIDFESEAFSRKFHVKSENRKFAYDVCHVRMMEYLLATRGWDVQFTGGYYVLGTGGRWSPEEFRAAADFTTRFFELIPEFVRREYAERAN